MSFIQYNETEQAIQANEALEQAIEDNNQTLIDQILATPIDGRLLCPSIRCLSEAICQNNTALMEKLLSEPYSLKPDLNCINYAAYHYTPDVYFSLLQRFPYLKEEVFWNFESSMESAIENTNIDLVKYLIETLRVPLSREFLDSIEDLPKEDDPFPLDERYRRNVYLRAYLNDQFEIYGVDEDLSEEEPVIARPPPSSRRRLLFDNE